MDLRASGKVGMRSWIRRRDFHGSHKGPETVCGFPGFQRGKSGWGLYRRGLDGADFCRADGLSTASTELSRYEEKEARGFGELGGSRFRS